MKPVSYISFGLSMLFLGMIIAGAILIGQNPPQIADSPSYNENIAKTRTIGIILVVIGCVMFTGMPMLPYMYRYGNHVNIVSVPTRPTRPTRPNQIFKEMNKW